MLKMIWIRFCCKIGFHELTCKAEEGISPPAYVAELNSMADIIIVFNEYARVYCKHCRKVLR